MSHWLAFELIFFQQRERARELSKLVRVPSQLWLIQQTAVKEFIAWHNVRTQLLRRIPFRLARCMKFGSIWPVVVILQNLCRNFPVLGNTKVGTCDFLHASMHPITEPQSGSTAEFQRFWASSSISFYQHASWQGIGKGVQNI